MIEEWSRSPPVTDHALEEIWPEFSLEEGADCAEGYKSLFDP